MPIDKRSEPLFNQFAASTASGYTLLVGLVIKIKNGPALRIVNNSSSLFYEGQEYSGMPFSFSFPVDDGQTIPQCAATISNIPAHISSLMDRYENYEKDITVQQFLTDGTTTQIVYEIDTGINDALVKEGDLQITMGYQVLFGKPFTSYLYDRTIAPGIFP